METIGQSILWTFYDGGRSAVEVEKQSDIRSGPGHHVKSFLTLAKRVAELQFRNREHVLLFRGQITDHLNQKRNSSLKPEIFRPKPGSRLAPGAATLEQRFAMLRKAERKLVEIYKPEDWREAKRLKQQQIMRWSILQHYNICATPLLDVTHSLRIAASFATNLKAPWGYVYVLGVPNLSGAITASAEAGLQIVRLSSVCPPFAVRPHIQEGYLLGEYPDITEAEQKQHYKNYEVDFGRRVVAKFRFQPSLFWKKDSDFPLIPRHALYPSDRSDKFCEIADKIKKLV